MSWWLHPLPAPQALQALRHDWDRLNREGPNTPLLSTTFMLPLLAHFAGGREVLACRGSSGRLSAMVLLSPQGQGRWQTFQPSQAPLGACVHQRDLDWIACLTDLLPQLPGFATLLGVTQQDPDLEPRPADALNMRTLDYIRTARITIDGSFDDYWQARGKNLRINLKKQRSRLEREGIATQLQIDTGANAVRQAIVDYGNLEGAGWKGERGTAVHPGNAQGRFYQQLLENFCRIGKGRIYRYWYNDRVMAMDLCIEGSDSLIVLKTAYDETAAGSSSPALLMRQEAVALMFSEPRLRQIEFYGRVLEWHTRWTNEVRTMFHCNVYRWQLLRALRDLLRRKPADADVDINAAETPPQS
ncbi:MAG: GNAT family N-acetyltransferase [Pseudomonadota bacterium]